MISKRDVNPGLRSHKHPTGLPARGARYRGYYLSPPRGSFASLTSRIPQGAVATIGSMLACNYRGQQNTSQNGTNGTKTKAFGSRQDHGSAGIAAVFTLSSARRAA